MLHDLVSHIAMNKSFDTVCERATEAYQNDPEFKLFVDLTLGGHFQEIKEQVLAAHRKTYASCPKGADVIGWREILREIATYQDGSPMKVRVRVSKIVSAFDHVDRDDVNILVDGLFNKVMPFEPFALMKVVDVVPKASRD